MIMMDWQALASKIIAPNHLLVNCVEEAENLIFKYEIETINTFTIFRRNKGFRLQEDAAIFHSHSIHWEDCQGEGPAINFTGVPHIIVGWDVRECQFGPDRNLKQKEKYNINKCKQSKYDHSYVTNKTRKHFQPTKKMQCPARIYMKRIFKFPDFKIEGSDSKWKRKQRSRKLREAMQLDPSAVKKIEEIHILLPTNNSHVGHITGEFSNLCQPVDSLVKKKIGELMDEGVCKVSEMKRHLNIFNKNELFSGVANQSRRFQPTDKDIRNHMDLYKRNKRFSANDQENLSKQLECWKAKCPEDNFFLRPSKLGKFLFAFQSKSQMRLLNLYGKEICLLDATYKTSKYSLPIFFLCVNTNVGFSIVGSFITADETKDSIREGLAILREWNRNWKPKCFMTDYDVSEIHAIEETFDDCHVYICDFHREQAWDRWLKTVKHNCAKEKDSILPLLRAIANSSTSDQFNANVSTLKNSHHWKRHPKFQSWFQHTWLTCSRRWVQLYRKELFNARVSTTNGLERQHLRLKQEYLSSCSDKSLTSLITILVNQFIPDSYKRYIEYNVKSLEAYRVYAPSVPRFLHNRPKMLVSHCLSRMPPNVEEIPDTNIKHTKDGFFQLRSIESGNIYTINLESTLPSCTCIDWQKIRLPCKHMLAVFRHYPGWDWDFLSESFRESPHFNIDPEVLENFLHPLSTSVPAVKNIELHVDPNAESNLTMKRKRGQEYESNIDKCKELVKSIQASLYNMSIFTRVMALGLSLPVGDFVLLAMSLLILCMQAYTTDQVHIIFTQYQRMFHDLEPRSYMRGQGQIV